jgi:hypothetical protein
MATKNLSQIMQDTGATRLWPRKRHEGSGIADVRSDSMLLKPDWIYWNAIPHQERDRFVTEQSEVNIRNDCTIDGHGTEYSDAR